MYSLRLVERHGYDIRRQVETVSNGTMRLGPGTTYRTLKRLLDAGLVREVSDRPYSEFEDSRRRYYRLTDQGLADLERALASMDPVSKAGADIASRAMVPDPAPDAR